MRAVTERQGRAGRTEKYLASVKDARTSLPALDPYVQTSVNTCGWGKSEKGLICTQGAIDFTCAVSRGFALHRFGLPPKTQSACSRPRSISAALNRRMRGEKNAGN